MERRIAGEKKRKGKMEEGIEEEKLGRSKGNRGNEGKQKEE